MRSPSRSERALVALLAALALGSGCAVAPVRHDATSGPAGDVAARSLHGARAFSRYDNFDGEGLVSLLGASVIVGGAAAYIYLERLKGRGGLRPARGGGGDGLPELAPPEPAQADGACGPFDAREACAPLLP